jgi:hypothetical protein
VDGYQRVEDVKRHVARLPVRQVMLPGHVLVERPAVDVLGDEIPVTVGGLRGPVNLHHVRVLDLAQRADLAAYGLVAGGVVEELEGTLLPFELVANPVD